MAPIPVAHAERLRAFTLIELIVVILVLATLSAVAVISYGSFADRAKVAVASESLRSLSMQVVADVSQSGASAIDRATVLELLAERGETVQDGLVAAAVRVGGALDSPAADDEYAAGFAAGAQKPQDVGGDRVALLVHGGDRLMGQVLDVQTGSSTTVLTLPKGTTPAELLTNTDDFTEGDVGVPRDLEVTVNEAANTWTASWGKAAGATEYEVEAHSGDDAWRPVPVTSRSASGPLPQGASVTVRVRSLTSAGEAGGWSTPATATRAPAAPAAPVVSVDGVTGAWTATWAEAPGAHSYIVEAKIGHWTAWGEVAHEGLSAHGSTALGEGQWVQVRLRSVSSSGSQSALSSIGFAGRSAEAPGMPVVTVNDSTGTWTARFPEPEGSPDYRAEFRLGGRGSWITATTQGNWIEHRQTVREGEIIEVRIRSEVMGAAPSEWSPTGTAARRAAVPRQPTVTVDAQTGAWTATWPRANGAQGYDVRVKFGSDAWQEKTTYAPSWSGAAGEVAAGSAVQVQVRSTTKIAPPSSWSQTGAGARPK